MAVKLNQRAYNYAQELVDQDNVVADERDNWSDHAPTADQENAFLDKQGFDEYGKWYLGVDDEMDDDTKGHYKFPFGDFRKIHRCGIIAAEARAAQNDYADIQSAAAHLHGMIEGWQKARE